MNKKKVGVGIKSKEASIYLSKKNYWLPTLQAALATICVVHANRFPAG